MTTASPDWQRILWSLLYATPQLVCYCIAIVFCFLRRRENPKGTAYLGLAVLVSLISTVVGHS